MNFLCPPATPDKKEYISDIGKILVKNYGKKKFYKPEEVKKAHRDSRWYNGLDFSCWGMSTFSSHSDFDNYHNEIGEICNYAEMMSKMLQGLSNSEAVKLTDFPDLDIDTSWLDIGDVFGSILEGIGDFISGIADGI